MERLPIEVQKSILGLAPGLAFTSSHFYRLQNDLYKDLLFSKYGRDLAEQIIIACQNSIKNYVRGSDYVRSGLRSIVSSRLGYQDISIRLSLEIYKCAYIADSWRLVYSLIHYRKHFFRSECLGSDGAIVTDQSVLLVEMSSHFEYVQPFYLPSGQYNLLVCFRLRPGNDQFGGIRFSMDVLENGEWRNHVTHFAAHFIQDIIKLDVVSLNLGPLAISSHKEKLSLVRFGMECKDGLPLKGVDLFYFDLKPDVEYFQRNYVLYTIVTEKPITYDLIVNKLEKQVAIEVDACIAAYLTGQAIPVFPHNGMAKEECEKIIEDFSVCRDDHEITRWVKFITVAEKRDYELYRNGVQFDKMRLNGRFLLSWRTIWAFQ